MKIAIIGSRSIAVSDIKRYIPKDTTEIVSGGAKGVDQDAKKYANENHISYKEYKPNYRLYGKGAPLKRNIEIINYADKVVALWDGKSRGTYHVIQVCQQKACQLIYGSWIKKATWRKNTRKSCDFRVFTLSISHRKR